MRLKDAARDLMPGHRLRISTPDRVDLATGNQLWSATLCDAQIIAYSNAIVLQTVVDIEHRTTYCLLAKEGAAVE